jgi:hypothetical protein
LPSSPAATTPKICTLRSVNTCRKSITSKSSTNQEFVVLAEDVARSEMLTALADVILAAIREPARVNGHEVAVSASIGVVESATAHADPSEIMHGAITSRAWARNDGGGRWAVFDRDRDDQETARSDLAAALPAAIERGELRLSRPARVTSKLSPTSPPHRSVTSVKLSSPMRNIARRRSLRPSDRVDASGSTAIARCSANSCRSGRPVTGSGVPGGAGGARPSRTSTSPYRPGMLSSSGVDASIIRRACARRRARCVACMPADTI